MGTMIDDPNHIISMTQAAYWFALEKARMEERAAIVAWLRENITPHNDIDEWADEIEAGEHFK